MCVIAHYFYHIIATASTMLYRDYFHVHKKTSATSLTIHRLASSLCYFGEVLAQSWNSSGRIGLRRQREGRDRDHEKVQGLMGSRFVGGWLIHYSILGLGQVGG